MTSLTPRTKQLPQRPRRARRSRQWMLDQLPVGMLDAHFFVRFLAIFQEIGDSLLANADNVDHLADVSVTPQPMVRFLGSWIGVESIDPSLDEQLQRRIVAGAARSLMWRGTASGLQRFLELISGGSAEVTDGGGVWRAGEVPEDTAWVRMRVETTGWMPEPDFVALVCDEVPAHVYAELYVGDRRVWPAEDEGAGDG
jgi:phage tail-like protein